MDWHSTLAGFGFLGGSSIEDLQASCNAIPEAAGVYILERLRPTPVAFLAANPGGRFKGRDPTVSVPRLEERWIPSADVVYLGKAGGNGRRATLRSRIRSFMQFGLGKPCSHWGGRCVWQLADAKALRVYWASTRDEEPTAAEIETHRRVLPVLWPIALRESPNVGNCRVLGLEVETLPNTGPFHPDSKSIA